MFITNMTKNRLGINAKIVLNPGETNYLVDESDPELVARISRLESAKYISVIREKGITKTGIRGRVVKALGADTGALGKGPRSKKVEETVAEPVSPAKAKAAEVVATTETAAPVAETINTEETTPVKATARRTRRKKVEEATTEAAETSAE